MPCCEPFRDMPSYNNSTVYVDNPEDRKKIETLTQSVRVLEAGLCALITELEKRGNSGEILMKASEGGLINLMDFWSLHSKEDEVRLLRDLYKYSEHERDVLRKLLNNEAPRQNQNS